MINPYHVYVCYGNVIKTYVFIDGGLYEGYLRCRSITGQNNTPRHIREEFIHYTIESALNACREHHNRIIEGSKKYIKQIVEHIKDLDDDGNISAAKCHLQSLRIHIGALSIRKRILERICEENYVSGEPF